MTEVFRGTIARMDNKQLLSPKLESATNISKFVGQPSPNIGEVESSQVNQIIWATHTLEYAAYVALSRFLAKYCVDEEFRNEVRNNPGAFGVVVYKYQVDPKDLFVFAEQTNRKVYPYENIKGTKDENLGHFLVQKGEVKDQPLFLSPTEIFDNLIQLKETDFDLNIRLVQSLFGAKQKNLYDRLEGQMVNSEMSSLDYIQLARKIIPNLSQETTEDLLARRFALGLVRKNYQPELVDEDACRSNSFLTMESLKGTWRRKCPEVNDNLVDREVDTLTSSTEGGLNNTSKNPGELK